MEMDKTKFQKLLTINIGANVIYTLPLYESFISPKDPGVLVDYSLGLFAAHFTVLVVIGFFGLIRRPQRPSADYLLIAGGLMVTYIFLTICFLPFMRF